MGQLPVAVDCCLRRGPPGCRGADLYLARVVARPVLRHVGRGWMVQRPVIGGDQQLRLSVVGRAGMQVMRRSRTARPTPAHEKAQWMYPAMGLAIFLTSAGLRFPFASPSLKVGHWN